MAYTNKCMEQINVMRKHIEATPEIMNAAAEAAMWYVFAELAHNPHDSKMWDVFDSMVDAATCKLSRNDAEKIAPLFSDHRELVACVFENIVEDMR